LLSKSFDDPPPSRRDLRTVPQFAPGTYEYVHALRIGQENGSSETESGGFDDVAYKAGRKDPNFFRRLFQTRTRPACRCMPA
jgi:hypothetical protein